MAYTKASLSAKLKAYIQAVRGGPPDDNSMLQNFCDAVAQAADEELDLAQVTVTSVTGVLTGGGTSGPGTGTVT
jgi:hypothetical protein